MHIHKLVWSPSALAVALLVGGCAEPSDAPAPSEINQPPSTPSSENQDVQPVSAESSVRTATEGVEPALATIDTPRVGADANEPAQLPGGPRAPIPLEEALDSGTAMPKAYFSEAHAALNKVAIGDPFPGLELLDAEGQKHALPDLVGDKATVVVFWNGRSAMSRDELPDLQRFVVDRFAQDGVAVIGVNVGDDPKLAAELLEKAGAKIVNLSDRDAAALAMVATEKLPRTYLLDPAGKIVWFDIEYSRTTRRDLVAGIRYLLSQK